jgi:hypothetical protein
MPIGKIPTSLAELNHNIVWNQMSADAKGAFIGTPEKVKLPAGFKLYKFTEFFITNRAGKFTEWWSPVEPYGIDAGLTQRLALAHLLRVNAADLTRVVAAVKENWNALTYILQAEITEPVYGFWGQCSVQRRLDPAANARPGTIAGPRTANLPGYAWQFYIPNLTAKHIREVSRIPVAPPL